MNFASRSLGIDTIDCMKSVERDLDALPQQGRNAAEAVEWGGHGCAVKHAAIAMHVGRRGELVEIA